MIARDPGRHAARGLCAALAAAALAVFAVRASAHGDHARDREWPLPLPAASAAAPDVIGGVPKRLYIANDDHTDYYWSAEAATYRAAFVSMLDYYMNQAEATAGNPKDARGKFNCDGSLWVREYEAASSAANFQRLVGHLRDGDITMPLNTAVLLYGAMPTEAVLRDMYWAGRLERREKLRFPLVVPMEDQTLPGGVASLWAGAGARYSWKGVCNCASQIDATDRPRETYRFTGPDRQSVLMKWNSQLYGSQSIGGYAEARNPGTAVDLMDSDPSFLARWPFPVAGSFGYGWDDVSSFTNSFVQAALDLATPLRRVIVSNEVDFFQDFEANHGGEIGSFSGAFGNEWDLHVASMGEVTAAMKRSVEKLRTAEALAAIATRFDPAFMSGREAARDSAFMACGLYYEHGWTADGAVSKGVRAAWLKSLQAAMASYVDALEADGLARLGALIEPPGPGDFHAIFNPLSWSRVDVVDLSPAIAAPRRVVDAATGLELPSQEVVVNGQPRLRVRVDGVPPVGYRIVEVKAGAGGSFPPAATVTLPAIDHAFYRVILGNRGQITSLVDHKDAERELVGSGGGALNDLGSGSGTVTLREVGPVSATIGVVTGSGPAHETKITLHAGIDRVEIEDVVTQNFGGEVSYGSRFDLPGAVMRHEEVGMIARVGRLSAGGDYADQNTRTDWLTFNHFLDLSQPARGVTVSNWDSPFFRSGASTPTTLDASVPSFQAVVGMLVDGPQYGILSQGGSTRFLHRFALRTHGPYDQAAAMRFALEHQNPLRAVRVTGGAGAVLPDTAWSLVQIDAPDVLLWAIKPAEESHGGTIARVWNLAEGPRTFALGIAAPGMTSARRTTHIETDLGPAPLASGMLEDGLERQQMRTYRLLDPQSADTTLPPSVPPPRLEVNPNPVRATGSVVAFTLASPATVHLTVHDLRGARIKTLASGSAGAGRREIGWGAVDDRGSRLAAGVYFVRLEAGGRVVTRRFVLLP